MASRIVYFFTIVLAFSCAYRHNEGTTRLGNFENRPRGFFSVYMPGGQIALYVPNKLKVPSTIVNVRVYIGKKGNYKKPFGLRIFCVDSLTGRPGKALLETPVIIKNIENYGWNIVNLENYNLEFPEGGMFVSMEWIPDDDFKENTQSECQFLAYSKANNENNTWFCALGINWYQLPKANYNAMISADVKKRGLNKAN